MEKQGIITYSPDHVRSLLETFGENLQNLNVTVCGLAEGSTAEVKNAVTERLKRLSEIVQQLQATTFSSLAAESTAAQHRMTMTVDYEQYY